MTSTEFDQAHRNLINDHQADPAAQEVIRSAAGLALQLAFVVGDISTDKLLVLYRHRHKTITDPAHRELFRKSFELASGEICASLREYLDEKEAA